MNSSQQLRTVIEAVNHLNEAAQEQFLSKFPFDNMLNISILDFESIRLHIILLQKISKFDLFYKKPYIVKQCCWEFVLTNILALENVPGDDIIFNLLHCLHFFISRLKSLNEYSSFIWKERERIINVLTFAVKLKIFQKSYVPLCTDIIIELIKINGVLPLTASQNLANIALIYADLQVVPEMLILCNVSFKMFTPSCEFFNVCMSWLSSNGSSLLESDDDCILMALRIANELQTNNQYKANIEAKNFISNLKENSHQIVLLADKAPLRNESLKLLATFISECRTQEIGIKEGYTVVLEKLLELPSNMSQWPLSKSDIFFYVCSYLCNHGHLTWSSSEILQAIAEYVYSYDRFTINYALLKNLCWIYSVTITDAQNKKNILLGDELIIILSKFPYSLHKIITYHEAQLVWILTRGTPDMKKRILIEWLKRDEDWALLGKALRLCKAGNTLLDIIADWKCDEIGQRSVELCHVVQDKQLSETIACKIPTTLHNTNLMGKLILANPGIPDDPAVALEICEFMSLSLCLIDDEKVLKAACSYCKNLVTNLKNQDNIIPLFCRNIKNILFLTIKVKYVGEETAIEILRLLKILVLVQKHNHSWLTDRVDADLDLFLAGCEIKTEKCLDLLHVIVTSKNIFIKLENSKILNMFTKLFDLSQNPPMSVRSFTCLTAILNDNQWLAQLHRTNIFIQIQCGLSANESSELYFLTFLMAWMKILSKSFCIHSLYLPDKMVVSNYIKRCNFITQIKENKLLRVLDKIYQSSKYTMGRSN